MAPTPKRLGHALDLPQSTRQRITSASSRAPTTKTERQRFRLGTGYQRSKSPSPRTRWPPRGGALAVIEGAGVGGGELAGAGEEVVDDGELVIGVAGQQLAGLADQ